MIVRVLNLLVIGVLVLAAAWVYRIKYDSAVQAERLAKLRSQVREERDRLAVLRVEWGELDNPARIEQLTRRFLKLRPVAPTQFDKLDHLPDRPPDLLPSGNADPIGGMIESLEAAPPITGSLPAARPVPPPASAAPAPASPAERR